MGVGREKKPAQELFSTPSSVKAGNHQTFVKSLLDKGYTLESQETEEDTGIHGEVISETLITIIKPPTLELPMLKFEAKETFGKYNYEEETFEEWEEAKFNVNSYKKSANFKHRNDPWQMLDLDD